MARFSLIRLASRNIDVQPSTTSAVSKDHTIAVRPIRSFSLKALFLASIKQHTHAPPSSEIPRHDSVLQGSITDQQQPCGVTSGTTQLPIPGPNVDEDKCNKMQHCVDTSQAFNATSESSNDVNSSAKTQQCGETSGSLEPTSHSQSPQIDSGDANDKGQLSGIELESEHDIVKEVEDEHEVLARLQHELVIQHRSHCQAQAAWYQEKMRLMEQLERAKQIEADQTIQLFVYKMQLEQYEEEMKRITTSLEQEQSEQVSTLPPTPPAVPASGQTSPISAAYVPGWHIASCPGIIRGHEQELLQILIDTVGKDKIRRMLAVIAPSSPTPVVPSLTQERVMRQQKLQRKDKNAIPSRRSPGKARTVGFGIKKHGMSAEM